MAKQATVSTELEHLAGDLHSLAFDFFQPATSVTQADRRIAEGERIAARVRAVVRGPVRPPEQKIRRA